MSEESEEEELEMLRLGAGLAVDGNMHRRERRRRARGTSRTQHTQPSQTPYPGQSCLALGLWRGEQPGTGRQACDHEAAPSSECNGQGSSNPGGSI
jgi:hypothetical protein